MQLDIHQITHDAYNPAPQIASWADIQTPYQLPSGKLFILPRGSEWTPDRVLARGVTGVAHNDFAGLSSGAIQTLKDAGKTYHSVPITPELLGIGASGPDQWVNEGTADAYNRKYFPNGLPNYAQGLAYGQSCDVSHRVTIGETMENLHYTNPRAEFWRGYYDGKTPRLIERFGQNYRQAHDYLFIGIGPREWSYINETQARAIFRNPSTAVGYDLLTNAQSKVNMYTLGVYLGGPDRDKWYVYNVALGARLYKQLGKYSVAFVDPEREWMPNAKNGNRGNEGILYKENKTPTPEAIAAGVTVAGLHFGDGMIPWGGTPKITNKIWSTTYMQQLFNGSYWRKFGEAQKRDWQSWSQLSGNESYTVVDWRSCTDYQAFAAQAYAETLGQVAGGQTKAVDYKIGSGSWRTAVNTYQDDLCYAKYNSAPIVETVLIEGKEAMFFCDPCSNNKKKSITIRSQTGATHTFEACGDTPHLAVWNT